jgi:hypothetical protein
VLCDLAGIRRLNVEICLSKAPDDVTEGRHVNKRYAPIDPSGIAKSRDEFTSSGPATLKSRFGRQDQIGASTFSSPKPKFRRNSTIRFLQFAALTERKHGNRIDSPV